MANIKKSFYNDYNGDFGKSLCTRDDGAKII